MSPNSSPSPRVRELPNHLQIPDGVGTHCIGVSSCTARFCARSYVCERVREWERVVGSAKSSVCQRSRSHGSLIPLPRGSENFLSSFPVLSPRWARRATPGKFMLMSAMKTAPSLHHISQYLSNSSPSILSPSLRLFSTISLNISFLAK